MLRSTKNALAVGALSAAVIVPVAAHNGVEKLQYNHAKTEAKETLANLDSGEDLIDCQITSVKQGPDFYQNASGLDPKKSEIPTLALKYTVSYADGVEKNPWLRDDGTVAGGKAVEVRWGQDMVVSHTVPGEQKPLTGRIRPAADESDAAWVSGLGSRGEHSAIIEVNPQHPGEHMVEPKVEIDIRRIGDERVTLPENAYLPHTLFASCGKIAVNVGTDHSLKIG